MLKKDRKPSILVTGASGFIGKHLIDAVKDRYEIIAMARRSSTEAGVPFHPNIRWIQWNIANNFTFNEVMGYLIGRGGADYVVHLAGYYDYEYDDNPEYERTNIRGTKNVLELARQLDVKHFIFASSLAACNFPAQGKSINEESPPDANFTYADSKRVGEELCREYSSYFKCSVVRLAAVFSDWCEYGPLYQFIGTWLSGKWDARILGGRGDSAITYIHISDLVRFVERLIDLTSGLQDYSHYLASPDGATTHNELFQAVTRDHFGEAMKPLHVPRCLTYPGLVVKKILSRIQLSSPSFEKFWMLRYVDRQLNVDAHKTHQLLKIIPTPRYHILRRMIYLLDKMKSHPNEWKLKNEAATKRKTYRSGYVIYSYLIDHEDDLIRRIEDELHALSNKDKIGSYGKLDKKEFKIAISTLYNLLLGSIRSADRILMQKYIEGIALKRFNQKFELEEVVAALTIFRDIIMDYLSEVITMDNLKQEIYDCIGLTMQLAIDAMEDAYEELRIKQAKERIKLPSRKEEKERQQEIKSLSAFYQEYSEEENG